MASPASRPIPFYTQYRTLLTPIVNGSCLAEDDITVMNGFFAISIARTTVPPWGVPNGSILDAAPIVDGQLQPDRITLVDFLPDAWAGWPSTFHKVTIEEDPADNKGARCVKRVERDYKKAKVLTRFIVEKGNKEVRIVSNIFNTSDETYHLYSGYSLCTAGGYMLAPFNMKGDKNELGYAYVEDEMGKFVVGYSEDWAVGLHFPAADFHDGGTGWKDLYELNILAPGDEYSAEAWLQFEPLGSVDLILEKYMEHIGKGDSMGSVAGTVKYDTGEPVNQPACGRGVPGRQTPDMDFRKRRPVQHRASARFIYVVCCCQKLRSQHQRSGGHRAVFQC